jgi:hypothetical protein
VGSVDEGRGGGNCSLMASRLAWRSGTDILVRTGCKMTEEGAKPLTGLGGSESQSAASLESPEICLRLEVNTELPLPLAAIPRRRDYSHCQKRRFVVCDDPEFLSRRKQKCPPAEYAVKRGIQGLGGRLFLRKECQRIPSSPIFLLLEVTVSETSTASERVAPGVPGCWERKAEQP